jgi:hypothetical protein
LLDQAVAPVAALVAAGALVLVPGGEGELDLSGCQNVAQAMAALEKKGIVASRDEVAEGEGI